MALPSKAALHTLVVPDLVARTQIEDAVAALPPGFTPERGRLEFSLAQARYRRRLTDERAAQLAVALIDHTLLAAAAWAVTCPCVWQRDLWLDLTRRLPDRYVAGPANLAAWCTWRRGEHALARFALRRAQHGPGTGLTRLIANLAFRQLLAGCRVQSSGSSPGARCPAGGVAATRAPDRLRILGVWMKIGWRSLRTSARWGCARNYFAR